MLKYLSVAAVVCLLVPAVRCEDKPDYAKRIVGKWEVTKADPETTPVGAIIEFTKDGKIEATLQVGDKTETREGTYTLDGDKIKAKTGASETIIIIVKISETEMSTKNKDGKEMMMKRVK